MPRSEEQFEEIRKEKSLLIRDVALRLFAEQGYHAVSISQIAKEAGISKGLMYNYFESKEDLLKSIMEQIIEEMFSDLDSNRDGILQQDELISYIKHTFQNVRERVGFWKLFYALSTQPGVLAIAEKKMTEHSKPIMQLVMTYFNSGKFDDPRLEIAFFGTMMSGAIQKYVFSNGTFPLDDIEKRIIEIYTK